MKEILTKNIVIDGSKNLPISIDIQYVEDLKVKPVALFIHGFKGFKDWGHFNLIAKKFVESGFVFVKMNTSHNGTSSSHPTDFVDLEAFGNNNFSIELEDVALVLKFIQQNIQQYHGNKDDINVIGHSRGGGIAILSSFQINGIKRLATWASVGHFSYFFNSINIGDWKESGVVYTYNSRTKQDMPLYFQLYEDYIKNAKDLDIEYAATSLTIPWLIAHGSSDESVDVAVAKQLNALNSKSILFILPNANHTFGGYYPYFEEQLPLDTELLVKSTIEFFLK
jgi:pimeloyl-ACP methyl ester carboxylesterase